MHQIWQAHGPARFALSQDNPTQKLMPARNWLHVEELPIALPTADGQPGRPEREHRYTKCACMHACLAPSKKL